jgi:hypothetical protein
MAKLSDISSPHKSISKRVETISFMGVILMKSRFTLSFFCLPKSFIHAAFSFIHIDNSFHHAGLSFLHVNKSFFQVTKPFFHAGTLLRCMVKPFHHLYNPFIHIDNPFYCMAKQFHHVGIGANHVTKSSNLIYFKVNVLEKFMKSSIPQLRGCLSRSFIVGTTIVGWGGELLISKIEIL